MRHRSFAPAIGLAALVACGGPLDSNCNASLDGRSVSEAKSLLAPEQTIFGGTSEVGVAYPQSYVEFFANVVSDPPAPKPPVCVCAWDTIPDSGKVSRCRRFGDRDQADDYALSLLEK